MSDCPDFIVYFITVNRQQWGYRKRGVMKQPLDILPPQYVYWNGSLEQH